MIVSASRYDPLEGLMINEELDLGWEDQWDIKGNKFKAYETIHKGGYQGRGHSSKDQS